MSPLYKTGWGSLGNSSGPCVQWGGRSVLAPPGVLISALKAQRRVQTGVTGLAPGGGTRHPIGPGKGGEARGQRVTIGPTG